MSRDMRRTLGFRNGFTSLPREKISTLDELAELAARYREAGKRVVMCHGMFDLVHLGHIRHLKQAKKEGDILMVTTTADEFSRKGPGRPVFPAPLRLENLAELEVVDHVAICPHPTATEAIELLRPDVYAKGKEYEEQEKDLTGMIAEEQRAVEGVGGRTVFTEDLTFSSSGLLNEFFGVFPAETKGYLGDLRSSTSSEKIVDLLDGIRGARVLVVGESIIDRYTFVSPLGQSGKGIHFAVRYTHSEDYAGGAIAVANHIAAFVDSVALCTCLGSNRREGDTFESFIRKNLRPNITPEFFFLTEAQTVVKERFVDDELRKFFEIYFFEEEPQALEKEEHLVCDWLEKNLPEFDVVVVPDYGNGFITDAMVQVLSEKSEFLTVNTQINSGNRGYHAVNRYPRANFISLNEPELRLACHNRHDTLESLASEVAQRMNADVISVTQGPKGLYTLDCNSQFGFRVPALASKVVDRVGAGDAFLALSSICLGMKMDPRIAAFIGAAAAALDVQIVGNRETIDPVTLKKYITALLK